MKSTSAGFNKKFTVTGASPIEIGRLTKPVIIKNLISLTRPFSKLNMQAGAAGRMCISFDDDDLKSPLTSSIEDPATLQKDLGQTLTPKKMLLVFRLADMLIKYCDSNFEVKKTA